MLNKLFYYSFLLLAFSLGSMMPYATFFNYRVPPADFLFSVVFALFFVSLAARQVVFKWHPFFYWLLFYFAALLLSAFFSRQPQMSFVKLAGESYLLTLPVIAFQIIDDTTRLKRAVYAYLAGTIVTVAVGLASIALFYIDRGNFILTYTLFHYGTLPPGNYPRLQATYLNANMLCNYLSVGFVLLLAARRIDWIGRKTFFALFGGLVVCALFTVSPGLGGIALAAGLWFRLFPFFEHRFSGRAALAAGSLAALLFVVALAVAPNRHQTAPFEVRLPIVETTVQPSSRAMAWIDAARNFAADPLVGRGVGETACRIHYFDLSNRMQILTDAHNTYLNVAAQAGVFGLLAIVAISVYPLRPLFTRRREIKSPTAILRVGLVIAFASAFVYQGLGGSFENARHLWVLLGLILCAGKIDAEKI